MALDFVHLTSAQLLALSRSKTVFIFPVGPLEDHGPHLPLGLDLFEAVELSRRTALRIENELPGWTSILMPGAPLGLDSNTQALALTVRPHVLRDWLVDACSGLMRAGFLNFIVFSGHLGPKQLTAIEEAGMALYKRTRWIRLGRLIFRRQASKKGSLDPLPFLISACSSLISAAEVRESPLFLDTKEHGGRRDTSVALAIQNLQNTSWVNPSYTSLPPVKWSSPSRWGRALKRWRKEGVGYWGKPAEGSSAWGEGVLSGTVNEVFPKIKAVLEGADPNLLFRSWYSVIPANRSFFKSWMLALSFLTLIMLWIFVNLQSLITGN